MNRPGATQLVFAAVLLVQPALQLAEQASDPQTGASSHAAGAGRQVAAIAAHPEARLLSVLLGIAALVLFVPLVLGLRRLLAERSPRLGSVGAAMALTGLVAFASLHGMDLAAFAVIRARGVEHVAAVAAINASGATAALTLVFLVGMLLGMLVLAVGLWRSRVVPRAAAALVVAFLVLDFASAMAGSKPLTLVAHLLLWLGSALIAATVLRERGSTGTKHERVVLRGATVGP